MWDTIRARFAVERSSDVDRLKSILTSWFPGSLLELGRHWRQFRAQISVCPLNRMVLYNGSYQGALRLDVPDSNYFVHGFGVRGNGEAVNNRGTTNSSPEHGIVAEPGEISFSTSKLQNYFKSS